MPRRSAPRPINRTNESNPVTMNQMNIFLKNKIKMSKDRLLQEQSTRMAEWRVSFTKLALFRTWRPEGKKERKLIVSLLSFPFLSSSSTDRHPPTSDALFRCLGYYHATCYHICYSLCSMRSRIPRDRIPQFFRRLAMHELCAQTQMPTHTGRRIWTRCFRSVTCLSMCPRGKSPIATISAKLSGRQT